MSTHISTGGVHHLTLTVTDVERSVAFYSSLLGFQHAADFGERKVLSNGSVLLVLGPPPDPGKAIGGDSFSENRVGLDHVSLSVESQEELGRAAALLDEQGIPRGEPKDLAPFGITVLAFRDPDNVQVELTAPLGG